MLRVVKTLFNSFDGGKRSPREARQIASDVSKYLAFANPVTCTWECLNNEETLKRYVDTLEKGGIGCDGVTTKLERIITASNYCKREKLVTIDEGVISRLDLWKTSFKRDKNIKSACRNLREPKGDFDKISNILFIQNHSLFCL